MRAEDSHLAKQAATAAAEAAHAPAPPAEAADVALPEPVTPVPVRDDAPALGTGRCVTLSANNPVLALLPQDPRRRDAIVLAVDNDVYLAHSPELAAAAVGTTGGTDAFYLPAGIAIPVPNKAAWWAAATTAAASSRISVMVNKDDD